jgi:hypothetical protein
LVTPEARAKVTVATTPLVIMLEFIPLATQLKRPELTVQAVDFPAAVNDGPTAAVAIKTSEAGKLSAQSMAAGSEPGGEEIERLTVRIPPPLLTVDNVNVCDCP